MSQLNQLIIEGNLVRDPEYKEGLTGKNLSTFTLAVNRLTRNAAGEVQHEAQFFDVEAWGGTAEFGKKNGFKKGDELRVVGRLKQNTWMDETGKKHSKLSIVAEHIDRLREVSRKPEVKKERSRDEGYYRGY